MAERVEHGGYLGVASFTDGEWTVVWRPSDPKWRLPLSEADTEHVSAAYYSQAMEEWIASVDTHLDAQNGLPG